MTTGKNAKRVIVAGTGGSFAYLRAEHIEQEDVYMSLQHDQIWNALQLIHFDIIATASVVNDALHVFENDHKRVTYVPEISENALAVLGDLLNEDTKTTIVYAWQPAIIKERVFSEHMSVEQIPEYLIARFGGVL
jgi:adenine-specific DNA-methyltransferase